MNLTGAQNSIGHCRKVENFQLSGKSTLQAPNKATMVLKISQRAFALLLTLANNAKKVERSVTNDILQNIPYLDFLAVLVRIERVVGC